MGGLWMAGPGCRLRTCAGTETALLTTASEYVTVWNPAGDCFLTVACSTQVPACLPLQTRLSGFPPTTDREHACFSRL